MRKTVVKTVRVGNETREIIEFESFGSITYKIKTPSGRYIGKVSDGGYKSLNAAVEAAKR